jgi:flagellar biosynthesis anti-sigma factor FlgM
MKIENGSNLTRTQLDTIRPAELAKPSTPPPAVARDERKDKVEFSERSLSLSKARGTLEALPEVRAERVSLLRDQVQSGTYQVPYDKLAGKLLDKIM